MTFNGKNNQPRKRSTNTRALSTRMSAMEKEMNPQVRCTGMTPSSFKPQFVTRKFVAVATLTTGSLTVKADTLGVPDGSKVLKVRVRNLAGRNLKISVPKDTGLLTVDSTGSSTAPFGGFEKYVAAPLSRFPTLVVNVPDLLARPLDLSGTETLFTVSTMATSADPVELTVTVRYTV